LPRAEARAIEGLVIGRLHGLIGQAPATTADAKQSDQALREELRAQVRRVTVGKERVVVEFPLRALGDNTEAVRKRSEPFSKQLPANEQFELQDDVARLSITVRLRTYGGFKRVEGWDRPAWTGHKPRPNKTLIAALAQAHRWREKIERGDVCSVDELATLEKTDRKQTRLTLRLAFLAPDIQRAMLDGHQPANLSLRSLLGVEISPIWTTQRDQLGLTNIGSGP
jgi:hypothetical protein